MEHTIKAITDSENEIEVTLTNEEIQTDIDAIVAKEMSKVQIDGFRKGKAPKQVVQKVYGDAFEYKASDEVANKKFWEVMKELNIFPIGEPVLTDIQFKPGEDMSFKVQYEVLPAIDPVDYTGNEIEVPEFTAADEDVQNEIDRIRKTNAIQEETDEVKDENTIITADLFKLNDDGSEADEAAETNLDIDLSNPQINPELKENAMGKKVGDSIDFSFEDDKAEEGKVIKYTYRAHINGIKKVSLPELDDEFVKTVTGGKVETADALKENIKNDIEAYYENVTQNFIASKLEETILENNSFTPPGSLVAKMTKQLSDEEIERAKKEYRKVPTEEELKDQLQGRAEKVIRWYLLRDKIIQKENLQLSEEKIKNYAEKNAEKMGVSPDVLIKYYNSDEMKRDLLFQEVQEFLKEKNTIKYVSPEELKKKQEKTDESKEKSE